MSRDDWDGGEEPPEPPLDPSWHDHSVCSVPECGRSHYAKGMCEMHYRRYLRLARNHRRILRTDAAGLARLLERLDRNEGAG